MADNTQQSRRGGVNRTEANGRQSSQSPKTANMPTSTNNSPVTLSPITESERENAILAAGILTSTVSTLVKAGLVRMAKNQHGEIVLIFPSVVWTDKLRLK